MIPLLARRLRPAAEPVAWYRRVLPFAAASLLLAGAVVAGLLVGAADLPARG
ncbi:MAG: hypothetical protein HOU01_16480, partial [Streptomycetaceae bacterium]|nr:hypothetical protein [Streptomycetaceae bacterium]